MGNRGRSSLKLLAYTAQFVNEPSEEPTSDPIIEVEGINNIDVDLNNLSKEQLDDVNEVYEIYINNPMNARMDAENIKTIYESGRPINEIRNEFYAELVNLSKSKNTYPLIENVLKGVPYEKNEN